MALQPLDFISTVVDRMSFQKRYELNQHLKYTRKQIKREPYVTFIKERAFCSGSFVKEDPKT
jgi:hypothetical protein